MTARIIAIGDIHGCSLALSTLIGAICLAPEDTVITLGDYINRGPDSPGVLNQLLALNQRCSLVPLMGNHEEILLSFLRYSLEAGGIANELHAMPADHLDFLRSCRDFYETDSHIFVHANYVPCLPLKQQPRRYLRWEFLDRLKFDRISRERQPSSAILPKTQARSSTWVSSNVSIRIAAVAVG